MKEFNNQTIIVTGGAGGMGVEIARRFLEEGAEVYITDINEKRLKDTVNELSGGNGKIDYVVADVSNVSSIKSMIETVVERSGKLNVLVNTAGLWVEGDTDKMTEKDWDRVVDVNLKGLFFCCSIAIPELEKTEGCIVNISSDAGIGGNPGNSIYNASKGGVTLITKSLGLELAPRGIRVNAIAPADVETHMLVGQAEVYGGGDLEGYYHNLLRKYPQGKRAKFIQPSEIAECVVFLASKKVESITATTLSIDCGLTAGY
jgi:NAD(P)-dependent dehydrogenase (short-subunit alcohol dehydrogenase family)